jgi:polysaccharide export outer membrane protein
MRHGRRARLIAGLSTALGLWAAGVGCQSAKPSPVTAQANIVSIGAPVAVADKPKVSGYTARAASPVAVAWHSSPDAQPGVLPTSFKSADSAGDDLLTGPPLTAVPDVEKNPPDAKMPEAKDGADLPIPRAMPPSGGPLVPIAVHEPFSDLPRELDKRALPTYVIEPPDILLIEAVPRGGPLKDDQRILGQHLVRPDGTVGLGIYGSAFVGGMTIEQAREAVAAQIRVRVTNFKIADLNVDVLAYNSKFYYVVTDGGGYGEQVYPFPITGSETVLDALGRINGLPPVADKTKVWVARRGPGSAGQVLPVDWCGIVQRGGTETNYQLMPGDRIYVQADHWIKTDSWIGKRLSPIERILGATLLGSQTVNSIRTNPNSSGSNGNGVR